MKFQSWTITWKLVVLSVISALGLIILQGFNFFEFKKIQRDMSRVGEVLVPALRAMDHADMMHDGLRGVVYRGLLGARDGNDSEVEESRKEFEEMAGEIEKDMKTLSELSMSEEVQKQLSQTRPLVNSFLRSGRMLQNEMKTSNAEKREKLISDFQGSFSELEKGFEELGSQIEKSGDQQIQIANQNISTAIRFGSIWALVGALAVSFISLLINRQVVGTLKAVVSKMMEQEESLKNQTDSLQESSAALSTSSTQQAAGVQETASAMEEINSMVAKTTENAQRLSESASTSDLASQEGQEAVQQMLSEMDRIKTSNDLVMKQIQESTTQIKGIVKVIGEIGEKTKVINEIVFQTKLLSFNASVEAARAGEHGKGFAVVAEEVGNLARMSGSAAKEITSMLDSSLEQVSEIVESNEKRMKDLISESTKQIENGRKVADECGDSLHKIVDQVREVKQLSEEMNGAMIEQRSGLDEIRKAVELFSQSTQANSGTAQKTSGISKELNENFSELQKMIADLQAMVIGTAAPHPVKQQEPEEAVSNEELGSELAKAA